MPGLTTSAVARLVEDGHLATAEEFSKEARRMVPMITRESAEAFKAKYIALGELASVYGAHPRQITSRLQKGGVEKCFPHFDTCYIYERQAAVLELTEKNPH